MSSIRTLITLATVLCAASTASAAPSSTSLSVSFLESAPKDSFTITNTGSCAANDLVVHIDLAASKGRLIFDPTASGAGVDVFQPLEVAAGQRHVASISPIQDGSQEVALKINAFGPGDKVIFTVDVDDTLKRSQLGQTRVANSEIENAKVRADLGNGAKIEASFGADASVRLPNIPCA